MQPHLDPDTVALVLAFVPPPAGGRFGGAAWVAGVRRLGSAWRDGTARATQRGWLSAWCPPVPGYEWVASVAARGFGGDAGAALLWACGDVPAMDPERGIRMAAERGHAAALGVLGHRARLPSGAILWRAAKRGHAAVLDVLAAAPFGLGHTDAAANNCEALRCAATSGSAGVVDRLAAPPYLLDGRCARGCGALSLAAGNARHGAAIIDRLAAVPFGLGRADAMANGGESLRTAVAAGNIAAIERLAAPPYALGGAAARGCAALALAARHRRLGVIDRLGHPPFSLGPGDTGTAVAEAELNIDVEVLTRLAGPPYFADLSRSQAMAHHAARTRCAGWNVA